MKTKIYIVFAALLMMHTIAKAQFVKSYQTMPQQNLTFNCISKSLTGTYFIAGIVDTSVYIAEVDQLGNKIREKLIGVGNTAYNLTSMITDADGNIVIVGSMHLALTNTQSFLMKISPVLSLLLHKTYDDITEKGSMVFFTDVKDYKINSTQDAYYISGGTRNYSNNTAADVLLITVNRTTGAITNTFSGSRGEDNYDALVLVPRFTRPVTTGVFATGRLSSGGPATFRPWINAHNSSLAFTGAGAQYLQPTNTAARLYSSSLIADYNNFVGNIPNLVYCWEGDFTSTGFGIHIGMGSYLSSTLNFNWQKQYVITTPPAANQILLNKVAADVNGYVAEGNWWDGAKTTTDGAIAGEMFLLRTNKAGDFLWSRRLDKIFINQRTHNAGMLIDSYKGKDVIYAVGFKTGTNGVNEGVLVQMPITGEMDTTCAPIQKFNTLVRDYAVGDKINTLAITMKDTLNYFPVDCVQTQDSVSCDSCYAVQIPSADFQLGGQTVVGGTFTATASSFAPGPNSQWIVSEVDPSNPTGDIAASIFTSTPGGLWGSASPTTSFGGYDGITYASSESVGSGTFLQGATHKYRFKHIVSATNNCGITVSDTAIKTISICTNCRSTNGGFIITIEKGKGATTGKQTAGDNAINATLKTIAYPNPANNSISFNLTSLQANNPVLQIMDARGQPVKTIKVSNTNFSITTGAWASGSYLYQVIAGGSIINKGSFIIQH